MRQVKSASIEILIGVVFYFAIASALTYPMIFHLDEVVIGGGELGGWFWRQWWHFEEIRALNSIDLGVIGTIEALVSLGRFPETGNILDLILLSYPLREWVGVPMDHNLKILIILTGNGLCGYTLARTFTDSKLVALGAGIVAIINPLVIQDINKLGLRQTFLWWLLLFPVFLQRASTQGTILSGLKVGICFTLISAFYWFYGLFAGMLGVIWILWWFIKKRPPWRLASRWLSSAAIVAIIGVFFFLIPYFSADSDDSNRGGVEHLPEVTFFVPYPAYDTIASAPERPTNYRENVLSSLHRGIDSAWPADYIVDPRHGVLAFPLTVFFAGIVLSFRRKEARVWLFIWMVFWIGTLGPFLKIGAQKDTSDVFMIGEYVVRLPYVFMFQFIPGMSRMFAPYRMCSIVVVASVILVAIGLNELRSDRRRLAAISFIILTVLQPFYRFDLGPLGEFDARPSMWRIPIQISAMKIPQWYQNLDSDGWEGIIELPLEQQQDLLCTYQSIHERKVYRSWATVPAIPPWIRHSGGGLDGRRMRWLAKSEPRGDKTEDLFRDISRDPIAAKIEELDSEALNLLLNYGSYRWLIVHQRGYYLVDPNQGDILYRDVVRRLSEELILEPERIIEQEAFEWPGKTRHFAVGPAWIPWASQEVQKPVQDMPREYEMSVFDLHQWNQYHGEEK